MVGDLRHALGYVAVAASLHAHRIVAVADGEHVYKPEQVLPNARKRIPALNYCAGVTALAH